MYVLMCAEELESCLAVAVEVAKKAGQIIKDGFHRAKAVEHKGLVSFFAFSSSSFCVCVCVLFW